MPLMNETHFSSPQEQLLEYATTVHAMHLSLHRIFANTKAVSESLTRTAASLRKISSVNHMENASISID